MHCPFCAAEDTKGIDSRLVAEGDQVRRRRECLSCSERFTTYEAAELLMPKLIKQNGDREPFNEDKLRSGILRALEKRPVGVEDIEAAKSEVEEVAKDTEQSMNKIVNSATFDPGASKESHEQADGEKSIKEELQEVSGQVEDVAKQLYGTGKNPKLARKDSDLESEAVRSLESSIESPAETEVASSIESSIESSVESSVEPPVENPKENKPEKDVS